MTKQAQADEIHASTVSDQPGRPVAAPCAISGCHYAEMDRALVRARMLHDATCFTDSGALRASVQELERELATKEARAVEAEEGRWKVVQDNTRLEREVAEWQRLHASMAATAGELEREVAKEKDFAAQVERLNVINRERADLFRGRLAPVCTSAREVRGGVQIADVCAGHLVVDVITVMRS